MFQQIGSLWLKRFRIFKNRLTILLATFLLPAFILLFHTSTQSKSNIIESLIKEYLSVEPAPRLELSLYLYPSPQTLLVSPIAADLLSRDQVEKFTRFVTDMYKPRANIRLEIFNQSDSTAATIGEYIYKKRLEKPGYFVRNFFMGLEFKFINNNLDRVLIYYNSMARHSQAVAQNEANSIAFAYATDSTANLIRTVNWPKNLNQSFDFSSLANNEQALSPTDYLSCLEIPPFSVYDIVIGISYLH